MRRSPKVVAKAPTDRDAAFATYGRGSSVPYHGPRRRPVTSYESQFVLTGPFFAVPRTSRASVLRVGVPLLGALALACDQRPQQKAVLPVAHYLQQLAQGCDAGDADQCAKLAMAHAQGIVAPLDPTKAAALWQRACEANHAFACAMAGNAYASGDGVRPDAQKAKALWERACRGKETFPDAAFACAKVATP